MEKKALAFLVRETTLRGYELACADCSVVLQINHWPGRTFPRHRCQSAIAEFQIVLELDGLVAKETRIDSNW